MVLAKLQIDEIDNEPKKTSSSIILEKRKDTLMADSKLAVIIIVSTFGPRAFPLLPLPGGRPSVLPYKYHEVRKWHGFRLLW